MTAIVDASPAASPRQMVFRPRYPLSLLKTVSVHARGSRDPTMHREGNVLWRASRTPEGVATVAVRQSGEGIHVTAWGSGAEWALDQLPALCGADDDPAALDVSTHPFLAEVARRNPGLRLSRTDLVFDALAAAIIEQKVTSFQAFGAWRSLVTRFGTQAPGPCPRPLHAPPSTAEWHSIPSWEWHRAGVEPPQARTIVRAAQRGERLSVAVSAAADGEQRDAILRAQPGIGPWTAAETRIRAFGDPDAVSVGDYHLAHTVGYALTGARTDDAGMLALLEPWRGQRQRVIRLLAASGRFEPRRGPRLAPEDHRTR